MKTHRMSVKAKVRKQRKGTAKNGAACGAKRKARGAVKILAIFWLMA